MIRQLAPWTDVGPASAITSATLQYYNALGVWVNCPTQPGNHWDNNGNYYNETATSFATGIGQTQQYLTHYDYNWVHRVQMSSTIAGSKLKLIVTGVTYGHFPDQASNNNHDNKNAYLRISEFVVI